MKKIHIISSGTGIGKTLVTCGLCELFNEVQESYIAVKPVISDFNFFDEGNDLYQIITAQQKKYRKENVSEYACNIFSLPLSPDMAAEKEGRVVANVQSLTEFINIKQTLYKNCIIEAVGGIMVPLNKQETYLDFLTQNYDKDNDMVILILGSYLGSLSHSLTTLEVLKGKGIELQFIVITQNLDKADELYIPPEDTLKTLSNFYSGKIITIEKLKHSNRTKAQQVKQILADEKFI